MTKMSLLTRGLCTSALLLFFCVLALGQNDCTLNSEHARDVLRNVGSRYPGGKTNLDKLGVDITWVSANGDKTTFGYGICYDLGSVISVTSKMKVPRSQRAVLLTALALGQRFWTHELIDDDDVLPVLKEHIQHNRFTIDKSNGQTIFNIQNEYFVMFYIEHTYNRGADTVLVVWQRIV